MLTTTLALLLAATSPAERFAADVTLRADAGYELRDVAIDASGDQLSVALVLSNDREAYRYALDYSPEGRHAQRYHVAEVAPPAERRVYPVEAELLAFLRNGAPGLLFEECGSFVLDRDAQQVALDERSYYLVGTRAAGSGADVMLATELSRALASEMEFVEMREASDRAGRTIELVLSGPTWRVIHVTTGEKGAVEMVEVRDWPERQPQQAYRHTSRLSADLKVGRAVRKLAFEPVPGGGERLVGVMRAGHRFVIEPGDFEPLDVDCGC